MDAILVVWAVTAAPLELQLAQIAQQALTPAQEELHIACTAH